MEESSYPWRHIAASGPTSKSWVELFSQGFFCFGRVGWLALLAGSIFCMSPWKGAQTSSAELWDIHLVLKPLAILLSSGSTHITLPWVWARAPRPIDPSPSGTQVWGSVKNVCSPHRSTAQAYSWLLGHLLLSAGQESTCQKGVPSFGGYGVGRLLGQGPVFVLCGCLGAG